MRWTETEIQNALSKILRRVRNDVEFRALVLRDPNAAISQVSSKLVPENFKIRFIEKDGADMTIVLPDLLETDAELSEADLELISGGINPKRNVSDHAPRGGVLGS